MHEVDTAVWRCSAQKKPPLHAHRPATTCEVTCEGAIENPTASERSAKSRSLMRTKFKIAKKSCRVSSKLENCGRWWKNVSSHIKTQEDAEMLFRRTQQNSGMCRVTSKLNVGDCVESHQNSKLSSQFKTQKRQCVESHQNSKRGVAQLKN